MSPLLVDDDVDVDDNDFVDVVVDDDGGVRDTRRLISSGVRSPKWFIATVEID